MQLDLRPLRSLDLGLVLIRIMIAVVGVFHGAQKLFGIFGGGGIRGTTGAFESMGLPLPMLSVLAIGSIEFFGGILIGLGLFMRIATLPFAFGMFVAAFYVHGEAFDVQKGGMEYPLTLAVVLLGLFFTGPGKFSVSGK